MLVDARHRVQLLEVLTEEVRLVAADDLDGEHFELGDVRREPRERLAARAADADEERVAARHRQDPLDAADVADRVGEQHEVHRLRAGLHVVVVEPFFHQRLQPLGVGHLEIRRRLAVGHRRRAGPEVAKVAHRALLEQLLERRREVRAQLLVDQRAERLAVGVVRQPVGEDAVRLVRPEARDAVAGVEVVLLTLEDALEDARDVAEIEGVVRLLRRGQQLGDHVRVDLERGGGHHLGERLDVLVEVEEVRGGDRPEDLAELRVARHAYVEQVEAVEGARRDRGAPAARVAHRRDDLRVLDVLRRRLLQVVTVEGDVG